MKEFWQAASRLVIERFYEAQKAHRKQSVSRVQSKLQSSEW